MMGSPPSRWSMIESLDLSLSRRFGNLQWGGGSLVGLVGSVWLGRFGWVGLVGLGFVGLGSGGWFWMVKSKRLLLISVFWGGWSLVFAGS